MSNEREEIAKENGMSMEFVNWFFDNKKDTCGYLWLPMLAAMWEGWKVREQQLAESQSKLEKMAAENAGLRLNLQGTAEFCYSELPETPATDAFLAEVRASAIPADVMDAIQKVARIRIDLNNFDGDKRGIVDCLGEAEESLIEVVNKFAAQLRQGGAE